MRTVIVTGGSKGIGLATACKLSAAGYRVIAVARHNSDALALAIQESSLGALRFHAFDLSDVSRIPDLVRSIRKENGPIYALVNNAASGTAGLLSRTKDKDIDNLIRLNTISPIILTKYVVRTMMVDGGGRVVNISSIVADTGYKGLAVYSATKASLVGFTRSLARELGPLNITVNAIAPGFVESDMTSSLNREERERIIRRSALQRLARPEDIASAIEFLLGDGGQNISGITLAIDAGSTA